MNLTSLVGIWTGLVTLLLGVLGIGLNRRKSKAEARQIDVSISSEIIDQLRENMAYLNTENGLLRKDLELTRKDLQLTRLQVQVLLRVATENGVTINHEDKLLLGLEK